MSAPANLGEVFDSALTWAEWWAEFDANACCATAVDAAYLHCGCGGSAQLPADISRLLLTGDPR